MYVCEKHGVLDSEWCDECGDTVQCDCSETEWGRIKDLYLNTIDHSASITLEFELCNACGSVVSVTW